MPFKFSKSKKALLAVLSLLLVFSLGMGIGYARDHVFSEDARFQAFTEEMFRSEVCGSTLTLHYSLAEPEKAGISRTTANLGTMDTDMKKSHQLCLEYEERLKAFSYSELSQENRLTLDMLLLYFHAQSSLGDSCLLEEPLSPSLGIQAQLPVLLAEYTFYCDEDITDYLNLLTDMDSYFDSILAFEKEKAQAGFFMSDTTLDRILQQCAAFVKDPDSNYMLEVFAQKLEDYGKFSRKDQEELAARHKEILTAKVIPAYRKLMQGLEALRGTGKSSRGLAGYEGGRQYYLYLLKSRVGTYVPVEQIEKRLVGQLSADCRQINAMLKEQPSLLPKLMGNTDLPAMEPSVIMDTLQDKMQKDFPALENVSYEIRYVHESMEDYMSPAFYLTPPLDTGSPNVIYINSSGSRSNLELFTTLAHEGFPGHLYQTVSFAREKPADIRYLISSAGYVEGWATYVESYAYDYAASYLADEAAVDIGRLAWLNRSVNLCIYSLLDIGIHYHGWNQTRAAAFLKAFGIRDEAVVGEIFQYIVETPANYLKYYWGYLNFLDLRSAVQNRLGENFDLKDFHKKILKIGPVPFPVLQKYIFL